MKQCALCGKALEGGTYITITTKPGKPHFCVSCAGDGAKVMKVRR